MDTNTLKVAPPTDIERSEEKIVHSRQFDVHAEKTLRRKLDLHLLPPVTLLYLFSFLGKLLHLIETALG